VTSTQSPGTPARVQSSLAKPTLRMPKPTTGTSTSLVSCTGDLPIDGLLIAQRSGSGARLVALKQYR